MPAPGAPKTLQELKGLIDFDLKVKVAGERVPTLWIKLF